VVVAIARRRFGDGDDSNKNKKDTAMEDLNPTSPLAQGTADEPRGRPFEPGTSGNPNGRPKGARNKTTMAMQALLEDKGELLMHAGVEKALEGDTRALRICLERLLPPRRDRLVAFDLPEIASAVDAVKASSAILAACAAGILSPSEATAIMSLIKTHVQTLDMAEIVARLTALEAKIAA
jgi:hypothetical protein